VTEVAESATPTDRLKIAYVYRHFNDSGSIPAIYKSRAELLAEHEDVTAFTSAASRSTTTAKVHFETVEPIVVGDGRVAYAAECASFALRATRKLKRLRSRFDVIHVEGFAAFGADMVMVHAVRPAEIEHYFENVEAAKIRRRLTAVLRPQNGFVIAAERRLFRPPYPLCLALTSRIGDDLQRHYGVPADLIEVMPVGIDLDRFDFDLDARARERSRFGTPNGRVVLLFVGDDFERKGLDQAICTLERTSRDVELWVAGGGDQEHYRSLAGSLGVSDRTRFLGRVPTDQLARLYSASDVLVLPSRQDAWGHPVIEAMAARRPVIVSPFAGSEEAVDSGVTGYVLGSGEGCDQIAALLDGPLGQPEAREAMGVRASASVKSFDRSVIFPRFRAAHHRAAALRRARLAGPLA
jgi:glycosyltransferase involved in cell wall biosynthesis